VAGNLRHPKSDGAKAIIKIKDNMIFAYQNTIANSIDRDIKAHCTLSLDLALLRVLFDNFGQKKAAEGWIVR
jgi:hypothetical protein